MSIGLQLLGSLLASSTKEFLRLQISEELFVGDTEKTAFKAIREHVLAYGAYPALETLEDMGVSLKHAPEPPQYYADKMRERFVHRTLKKTVLEVEGLLNSGKVQEAQALMLEKTVELNCTMQANRIVDFAADGAKIIFDEYNRVLSEVEDYGLRFGWPTLDKMTGGLAGGDVITIVARPGMGKTFLMLYVALSSWKHKYRPMFVSMEMKPAPIVQRLGTMVSATPISALKEGFLSKPQEKKLKKILGDVKKKDRPFWVVDGNLTATPQDILMMARQLKPDVVFIDAAYLLRNSNKYLGRWDRVTENIEFIKSQIAEELNIPVFISYQLNREAEKKKKSGKGSPGLEDIAYTDAIGQISSVVLGLFEEDGVETVIQRAVTILKGRNGETGSFSINWQFSQTDTPNSAMNFSEVQKETLETLNFLS